MEQGKRDGDPNKNPNQQPKRSKGTKFPVPRPPPRKCPRCESFNTHFCYYNNYNLSQPRYLCNACQRHWTHGGTLRDIPVGGRRRIPKARPGKYPPVSCGESSRSRPPGPPSRPPPPQQEAPPPSKVQFPNVSNMNAMFSGISSGLPPITGANIYPYEIFTAFEGIQMPSFGLMNQPLRIGGGSGSGSGAGAGAGANNNRPIFPRMMNNPPMHGPGQPPQADGRGNKNKGKQPMYTPDKNPVLPAGNLNSWTPIGNTNNANGVSTCTTNLWNNIPVLPAGNLNFWTPGRNTNNTNGTSTSSSNLWNNINGASTSNGMNHESSSNPPNNHQDHDAPQ